MKLVDKFFEPVAIFRFDFDAPITTQPSFVLIAQGFPHLAATYFSCKTNSGRSAPMTKVTSVSSIFGRLMSFK